MEEHLMAVQLGDTAPDFTAETTEGRLSLHKYLGDGWGILFSHPADFTPVCTTELGALQLSAEYGVSTPVDWKQGDDVIISPATCDDDARTKFPKGFITMKPY